MSAADGVRIHLIGRTALHEGLVAALGRLLRGMRLRGQRGQNDRQSDGGHDLSEREHLKISLKQPGQDRSGMQSDIYVRTYIVNDKEPFSSRAGSVPDMWKRNELNRLNLLALDIKDVRTY